MGEELKALVVLDPDQPAPTGEELIQFARSRIAHFKCPRSVEFRDLPRTEAGKLPGSISLRLRTFRPGR